MNQKAIKKYCLYTHTRLDTSEIFYVGIGKQNQGYHKRPFSKRGRTPFWQNIINKTDYSIIILEESDERQYIISKEIELITEYGRRDLKTGSLVNLTGGGDGNLDPSPERSLQLSNFRKGKKMSEETKEKLKIINTGRIITWGDKITIANTGRKISQETKDKVRTYQLANKKIGKDNTFSIKVVQLSKQNIYIQTWNSAMDAERAFDKRIHISECCQNKQKTSAGYKWIYEKDYIKL